MVSTHEDGLSFTLHFSHRILEDGLNKQGYVQCIRAEEAFSYKKLTL